MVTRNCLNCSIRYTARHNASQFCTRKCNVDYQAEKRKNGGKKKCLICQKEFERRKSQILNARYCSRACADRARSHRTIIQCDLCGNDVDVQLSKANKRYCSPQCFKTADNANRRRVDLLGYSKNYLTCIDNLKRGRKRVWKCECGVIKKIDARHVTFGTTTSCGCRQKELVSILGATTAMTNHLMHKGARWHIMHNGKTLRLRSGYEYIYARFLIEKNIDFEYEPTTFKLANGVRYTPDFLVAGKYTEVKGYYTEDAKAKHKLFIDKTSNELIILLKDDIQKMLPGDMSLNTFYTRNKKEAA